MSCEREYDNDSARLSALAKQEIMDDVERDSLLANEDGEVVGGGRLE